MLTQIRPHVVPFKFDWISDEVGSHWNFLIKIGRAKEAVLYTEEAVALAPTISRILTKLAEAYFYSGKNEKVTETLIESESLFPNQNSGNIGQLFLYLDNLEKAIEILELRLERSFIPRFYPFLQVPFLVLPMPPHPQYQDGGE